MLSIVTILIHSDYSWHSSIFTDNFVETFNLFQNFEKVSKCKVHLHETEIFSFEALKYCTMNLCNDKVKVLGITISNQNTETQLQPSNKLNARYCQTGYKEGLILYGKAIIVKGIVHLNIIFSYMKVNKICKLDHLYIKIIYAGFLLHIY